MLNKSFIIRSFQVFFFLLIPGMLMISCNKEEITTNPSVKLTFSADTVVFDTVFATIGTTTRYLMVYNNDKNRVKIASVRLAGGSSSPFELNIDFRPGVPNPLPEIDQAIKYGPTPANSQHNDETGRCNSIWLPTGNSLESIQQIGYSDTTNCHYQT